ncbi:hypothetical protein SK803_31415 [Lentzea sp. BCCO 10_0856]|uniref:Guanylate cyclase domain-containing protein n=1 Tax=Lentzea miocenica TaxID=3095431 RepID=A0ABU4TA05_9PSEU|nr:hypothetical protein [Lentzea sp. BCCO 10_0856]MDX8034748.1 hypothetical protein [Lentzea sp. BCCO 10_0856]
MNPVPEHRTLLGVDVIGSAQLPGYLMNAVPGTISKLVGTALTQSGIEADDVLSLESPGDGALLVLPSGQLGAVLDAAVRLDQLIIDHNRWHKPEVRLRVAVHVGPVGDDGFHRARITHTRLLDAPEFKNLLKRCHDEGDQDTANTALIVSSEALDTAFSGDHTQVARRSDFASLAVSHKEYRHNAWVRVPGFDPRSLAALTGGAAAPDPVARTQNIVHGHMNGIQADTINGGLTFYGGSRP